MKVGRNADHIDRALALLNDIVLVIAASDIGHDGDLRALGLIAHDRADIVIRAEFPFTELLLVEHLLRAFIAEFHVVNAGLDIGLVESLHEFILEEEIVYQAAVSQRRVDDPDAGSVAH